MSAALVDYARRIVDAEARAAWSEARRLRAEALAAGVAPAPTPSGGLKDSVAWETEKAELARLRAVPVGSVLRYPRSGEVRATCERVDVHVWRVRVEDVVGDFASISAAAVGACRALGLAVSKSGWVFWGVVDKRGRLYARAGGEGR